MTSRNMAKVSTATAGRTTLRVAVEPTALHRGAALGQGRHHSSNARTCSSVSGPAGRICSPPRKSWCQSHQPHTVRVHGHTILQEKRAAEIYDEVGQRSFERLFTGIYGGQFMVASHTQRRPLRNRVQGRARHRGSGTPGSTHSSQTADPGNNTGRSPGLPSTETTLWRLACSHRNQSLKQTPPPVYLRKPWLTRQQKPAWQAVQSEGGCRQQTRRRKMSDL